MPGKSEDTSGSLLDRAKSSDAEAWRRLIKIYGPMVYGWARTAGLQASDAGDITQQVFMTVSFQLQSFRGQQTGESFRGWLWAICRNKIRDFFRGQSGQPLAMGGTSANLRMHQLPQVLPEQSDMGTEEIRQLRHRALREYQKSFSLPVWEAFWMVAVEGHAPGDVASNLGVSVWAVYKAKERVLHRLREELQGLMDLPD